jgi:hypothetical protein
MILVLAHSVIRIVSIFVSNSIQDYKESASSNFKRNSCFLIHINGLRNIKFWSHSSHPPMVGSLPPLNGETSGCGCKKNPPDMNSSKEYIQ